MRLKAAIEYFNIPREAFDRAYEETITNWYYMTLSEWENRGLDFRDEWHELPNGDIIYTFDDEIINYFYRWE